MLGSQPPPPQPHLYLLHLRPLRLRDHCRVFVAAAHAVALCTVHIRARSVHCCTLFHLFQSILTSRYTEISRHRPPHKIRFTTIMWWRSAEKSSPHAAMTLLYQIFNNTVRHHFKIKIF